MNKRITSFDSFKTIAAFLVVTLHYPLQGKAGLYLSVIARTAVPFFFLVSGYFNYSATKNPKRILKEMKKLILICVMVDAIYLFYRIVFISYHNYINDNNLIRGIYKIFKDLLSDERFLLINFKLAGHMWYIRALIYMLVVMVIMEHLHIKKLVAISIPVIMITDLICCKYSRIFFGRNFPRMKYEPLTKFVGVAYVFFFLGYFIREWSLDKGKYYLAFQSFVKKRRGVTIGTILALMILNLLEWDVLEENGLNVPCCNFAATSLVSLSVFLFLECNPFLGEDSVFAMIGKRYSMYIYLFHIIVGRLVYQMFNQEPVYDIYLMARPFFLYLLTMELFVFIFFLKRFQKNK